MSKVIVGKVYKFVFNNLLDKVDSKADVKEGDVVRVVNLSGAPKANTMGQCYIETLDGKFLGMVSNQNLESVPEPKLKTSESPVITTAEFKELRFLMMGSHITAYTESGEANKRRIAVLNKKLALTVVKKLCLQEGEYKINYNPAGIACSGDTSLYTNKLEVFFYQCSMKQGNSLYYRQRESLDSYNSGANHWMTWKEMTVNKLVDDLKFLSNQRFKRV
jgi:hypothetical protein